MLVLSRKIGESVFIEVPASDAPTIVEVRPVRITANNVRLGITAPRRCQIVREELEKPIVAPAVAAEMTVAQMQDLLE